MQKWSYIEKKSIADEKFQNYHLVNIWSTFVALFYMERKAYIEFFAKMIFYGNINTIDEESCHQFRML